MKHLIKNKYVIFGSIILLLLFGMARLDLVSTISSSDFDYIQTTSDQTSIFLDKDYSSLDTIAYWAMEDLSDSSGNGHILTNYGATSTIGKLDNAYSFDGTNDYISENYDLDGVRTINQWVYIDSSSAGFIYWTGTSDGKEEYSLLWRGTSNGNIGVRIYDNTGTFRTVNTQTNSVSTNTWTMVTSVFEGSYIKVYLNGVQSATLSISGITDYNQASYWGKRNYASSPTYFGGKIDEVSIYDRALTSTEISQIYSSGIPKYSTGSIVQTLPITLLSDYDTLSLSYTSTLNGGTITPYLIVNDVEQSLTNNELSGHFVSGDEVKIKFALTGDSVLDSTIELNANQEAVVVENTGSVSSSSSASSETLTILSIPKDTSKEISNSDKFSNSLKYYFNLLDNLFRSNTEVSSQVLNQTQ